MFHLWEAVAVNLMTRLVTAGAGGLVVVAQMACTQAPEGEQAQPAGLPSAAVAIAGWELDSEPRLYVGDALFELVNGGAELYRRFGFVQALSAQYSGPEGRSIALEIFEMRDGDAAHGIFMETAGSTGEAIVIGDEAALDSYFLNARSGRFLVTLTGFDSDRETKDGLLELARAVVSRLGGHHE